MSSTFQLLPMQYDDLREACRQEIYGNPDTDAQRVLLDRERTPQGLERLLAKRQHTFQTDRDATWLKVVAVDARGGDDDDENNKNNNVKMVGWAVWHLVQPSSPQQQQPPPLPAWPLAQFYRPFWEMRWETLQGRQHFYLGMIVTLPEYRRRGVATSLVQWGIDAADEMGLEIYLESSVAGLPMYEKFGWRQLKSVDFDMAQLGYEGVDTHIAMVKDARGPRLDDDGSSQREE